MKKWVFYWVLGFVFNQLNAQSNFLSYQQQFPKVANALKKRTDTLKKQLSAMQIHWPVQQIFIRSFKYDSQLEVWVRNKKEEPYRLFKTYKVCALSGAIGPKRIEGDYQVPEGFYYINEFNPRSNYHLALGLNYPNYSDKLLSDSVKPGAEIYIHGSCITVGCIPIMDNQIEELYILAAAAQGQGQDFIPVHIFPIRYNVAKSREVLKKAVLEDASYLSFSENLQQVFNYFEHHRKLPVIAINKKGEYLIL